MVEAGEGRAVRYPEIADEVGVTERMHRPLHCSPACALRVTEQAWNFSKKCSPAAEHWRGVRVAGNLDCPIVFSLMNRAVRRAESTRRRTVPRTAT